MKKIIAVFLMVISLFILSCSGNAGNGAIVINMGAEPRTIDPSLNSLNVVSAMLYHPFESLTKIGAAFNNEPDYYKTEIEGNRDETRYEI